MCELLCRDFLNPHNLLFGEGSELQCGRRVVFMNQVGAKEIIDLSANLFFLLLSVFVEM